MWQAAVSSRLSERNRTASCDQGKHYLPHAILSFLFLSSNLQRIWLKTSLRSQSTIEGTVWHMHPCTPNIPCFFLSFEMQMCFSCCPISTKKMGQKSNKHHGNLFPIVNIKTHLSWLKVFDLFVSMWRFLLPHISLLNMLFLSSAGMWLTASPVFHRLRWGGTTLCHFDASFFSFLFPCLYHSAFSILCLPACLSLTSAPLIHRVIFFLLCFCI